MGKNCKLAINMSYYMTKNTHFEIEYNYAFYHDLLIKFLEKHNRDYVTFIKDAKFEIISAYDTYTDFGIEYIGHRINLYIHADNFLSIIQSIDKIIEDIKNILNKLYRHSEEYIHSVEIMANNSNISVNGTSVRVYNNNFLPLVNDEDIYRIWGNKDTLKIFISHRDKDKKVAEEIKNSLVKFNISAFVAHKDIEVTKEWEKEILRALQSMDILIAYMTDDFFGSIWTNQEIGFALGRNIFIIPIKNMTNPKGFISNIQALQYNIDTLYNQIVSIILHCDSIQEIIINKLIDISIHLFSSSHSFAQADSNFSLFEKVRNISQKQESDFIEAFYNNMQIWGCFSLNGFNVKGQKIDSGKFCSVLNLLTGKDYSTIKTKDRISLSLNGSIIQPLSVVNINDVPF
jgi:hypothetical protein